MNGRAIKWVGELLLDDPEWTRINVAGLNPRVAGATRVTGRPKAGRHAGRAAERRLQFVYRTRLRELSQLFDVNPGVVVALVVVGVRVALQIPEVQDRAVREDEPALLLLPGRAERLVDLLSALDRRLKRNPRAADKQALGVLGVPIGMDCPLAKAGVCLAAAAGTAVDGLEHGADNE
jgi:hypothetical protein